MRMGLGGSRDVRTVKRNQQIRVQVKRLKEGRPKLRAMIEKEKAKKKVRTHSHSVALACGVVTRAPPPAALQCVSSPSLPKSN